MTVSVPQAEEITPLLQAAVQSQIECWRFQREIELRLGVDFKNMELALQDLAAAGDPQTIDSREAQDFIASLEVECAAARKPRKSPHKT